MAKKLLNKAFPALLDSYLISKGVTEGIEPVFSTNIPGATYTITPIDEGVINHSQVEIKVLHPDYDEGSEILNEINNILNITEQKKSIRVNGMELRPVFSGGGYIYSDGPQAWELSSIFIITWRCL